MPDRPSLLARRLRAHRAANGSHGRMTQEQLAERLGVSVDAIGKYERSVSYLRGDLEHRLGTRLGWSADDVRACREDWEARRRDGSTGESAAGGYRLLDAALIDTHFNGSLDDVARATVGFSAAHMPNLPPGFEADPGIFVPISTAYPDHWATVMQDDAIVATWALPFLLPEDVARFRSRDFRESGLSVDRLHQPILPGRYFGYCTTLVVARGHEAASPLLLSSFVTFLEGLLARDVFLDGLGTVSVTDAGAQICRDLGMDDLGPHRLDPALGVWELPGRAIARSIFARRSPAVRRRYAAEFRAGAAGD